MVAERDLLRHVAEYCTSHLVLCRMRYPLSEFCIAVKTPSRLVGWHLTAFLT